MSGRCSKRLLHKHLRGQMNLVHDNKMCGAYAHAEPWQLVLPAYLAKMLPWPASELVSMHVSTYKRQ